MVCRHFVQPCTSTIDSGFFATVPATILINMSCNGNTRKRLREPPVWTLGDEHEDFAPPSPPRNTFNNSESGEEKADRNRPIIDYPSVLQLDSEYTSRDTDNQPGGPDYIFGMGRNTGSTAPEVPNTLKQLAANRQPRTILGLERLSAAGVLADPTQYDLIRHGTSSADFLKILRSHSSSYTPYVAPTHTTYSLAGSVHSDIMPVTEELEDLFLEEALIQSPCFFKDILQSNCARRFRSREDFRNHMLSHFGEFGPPPRALCIFCNHDFTDETNPLSCWEEYLDHLRYQDFHHGAVVEQMRPDFLTWKYLLT